MLLLLQAPIKLQPPTPQTALLIKGLHKICTGKPAAIHSCWCLWSQARTPTAVPPTPQTATTPHAESHETNRGVAASAAARHATEQQAVLRLPASVALVLVLRVHKVDGVPDGVVGVTDAAAWGQHAPLRLGLKRGAQLTGGDLQPLQAAAPATVAAAVGPYSSDKEHV